MEPLNEKRDLDRIVDIKKHASVLRWLLALLIIPILYQDGYWFYSAFTNEGWLAGNTIAIVIAGHGLAVVVGLFILNKFYQIQNG
jgi:hypothetical protein